MSKIVFRFDIDTHKCIRNGVPNLLNISKKYNVDFTFFLNTGRAIDICDSLKQNKSKKDAEDCMLSAKEKFGLLDYIECAIFNPDILNYKESVKRLLESSCEVGLHGGSNHALWHRNAKKWSKEKLAKEILQAISKIKKIDSSYNLSGFASPGWNRPSLLPDLLQEYNFLYYGDWYSYGEKNIINKDTNPTLVGVNLLSKNGGIAYFENCIALGMNSEEILLDFIKFVETHPITIIYDHPYFAGCSLEIQKIIEECIVYSKKHNHEILTIGKLLEKYI
ncbi:MAG: polysaccharide deacetylase family protein [Lachnospiraceae bacterium]